MHPTGVVLLIRWTDQGRAKTGDLPERVEQVEKRISELGARSIGNSVTMGRFDQVAVVEAPTTKPWPSWP